MSGLRERMLRLRGGTPAPEQDPRPQTEPDVDERKTAEDGPGSSARETAAAAASMAAFDSTDHSEAAAWARLQVDEHVGEQGSFLLRRVEHALDARHGLHVLGELAPAAGALAAFHRADPEAPLPSADNLLFLDLETTGLGVGTGNVPFMVGIAYAAGERFVVEQLFIRHPAEERAMLAYLEQRMQGRSYLVTYNGKTFDWPVLAGRYIMNGFGRRREALRHLDFLHPSRSIWRNTLTSCRLSHVEEERLGIRREHDVPGSEAPAIYFRYLADGDPAPLAGVFRHNELDMLSLAALAIRFGRLLGGELQLPEPEHGEERMRTALWLEKMGASDEAERRYERLTAEMSGAGPWALPLAARDKKVGNWRRAVVLWQKIALQAEEAAAPCLDAHIELAMYYEHRVRDLKAAIRYAEAAERLALRRAGLERAGGSARAHLTAIRSRLERLQRKTNKGNGSYGGQAHRRSARAVDRP
ncbi:ribonuclease H-like domain-containing protein [Paenibacillus sp. IB182496]|uniref:Ribonuclease H-like domain-containing protein n=1 Tax=Paenibacillus sabuli TaxID=2772509 RepID=A0A927GUQ9_9BACL|nr:ribonuclease H-like domain-containing protein [Paenibacillus sabuli]MBD2847967.1 ribonuclease H-like domain-containing protein [Paenibacillus sabuli]